MNLKTALLGFALLVPATTFSADALAFAKCDKMEDEKKKAKCEKGETKRITKLRAKTTPLKPSAISPAFADLDGDDANPFNMDDFYLGTKTTGIAAVDEITAGANRIMGAVAMAAYIGSMEDKAAATKLAAGLLPVLAKLPDEGKAIVEKAKAAVADPTSLVKDNPAAALKIPGALGPVVGQLPGTLGDIPEALKSVKALAGGAAGAAMGAAMDKAKEATAGAAEAVEGAKEAVEAATGGE